MRILFVSQSHLDSNSGIHIYNLANQITKMGGECVVCVPEHTDASQKMENILFEVILFEEALETMGPGQYDLIHAWTPREHVRRVTQQLAAGCHCPYIVHLEDNEEAILESFLGYPMRELQGLPQRYLDAIVPGHISHPQNYKEFLGNAQGVTVIMDTLLKFCPSNIPNLVMWAGFEEELQWHMPKDKKFLHHLGIDDQENVVVYTGNVHQANKQEVSSLYLAVGILNRSNIKTRLVRTGRNQVPLLSPAMDKILQKYVVELEWIPRKQLPALLSIADVLVQPGNSNIFNDYRFPSKLPEYLATGKPVLLPKTNIGRFLKDGEECLLLTEGDALEISNKLTTLILDKPLAEKIGRGGRQFAEDHLKWSVNAKQLYAFYKHVSSPQKHTLNNTFIQEPISNEKTYGLETDQDEFNEKISKLSMVVAELKADQIELSAELVERDKKIEALTGQVVERNAQAAELREQLRQVTMSKGWRLILFLRRISDLLFPRGSLRSRIAKKFQTFMLIPFNFYGIYKHRKHLALIRNSGLFDPDWYIKHNPGIPANMDLAYHYLMHGGFENRDPGPRFSSGWYLDTYNDVKEAGINPLVHYLKSGKIEGRSTKPEAQPLVIHEFETASGPIKVNRNKKESETAVILHLYYVDLFDEIKRYLQNLGNIDLYISIPRSNREYQDEIFESFPNAKIYFTENKGRDVLPFIAIYNSIVSLDYKYLLKIHTKKSPHREDGVAWREDVFGKLMGSTENVDAIKSALDEDATIGIIGPKGHVVDYRTYTWHANRPQVEDLARKVGIYIQEDHSYSFVAGFMFWVKPASLQYLSMLPIESEDFEPEPLGPDGALVHALERFTGLVTQETGYSIYESDCNGKISKSSQDTSNTPYPFGIPILLSYRHRLAKLYRKIRLLVFPAGSKREIIAGIFIEAIKKPQSPNLSKKIRLLFSLITPEYLSIKLHEYLLNKEYVISLSHDDYTRIVGGVQLVVVDEQAAYNERGIDYLHIYPLITNPGLPGKYEPSILGININGKNIGALNGQDLIRILRRYKSKHLSNVIIHHTMGFEISFIHRILNEVGHRKGRFWLHDNFSICPSYTLLRNDLEYCGAPDINSETCLTCKHGHARRLQQPAFRKFFTNNFLEVVSPSQFTLDLWKEKSTYPAVSENIAPHLILKWKGALLPRTSETPLRIGFVGYPVYWKGWETWLRLIGKFHKDNRYQFYFFSSWRRISDEMKWINTSVTKGNRQSMVDALRNNQIDVTVLWSLCPETFSFTLFESLAAGCYIITYKDSGNIQAYLRRQTDQGLVLKDESSLFDLFTNDELITRVNKYQKNGKPQGELSFLPEFDEWT